MSLYLILIRVQKNLDLYDQFNQSSDYFCGWPPNLVTTVSNPTIESAQIMMHHADINLLVVTGGPAVVAVAMKSGKKVIAAGPGNPPVVVDETADIEKAAKDIVTSASTDNNIICIVEKNIIVTPNAADALKKH